jgi:hypothetical protein
MGGRSLFLVRMIEPSEVASCTATQVSQGDARPGKPANTISKARESNPLRVLPLLLNILSPLRDLFESKNLETKFTHSFA